MNAGKAFRTPDRASLETEESEVAFHCKNIYFLTWERTCRVSATVGRREEGEDTQPSVEFDQKPGLKKRKRTSKSIQGIVWIISSGVV